MIICMSRKFTNSNSIKTKISDHWKNRKIVINLWIQSISSNIEICCQDFYHCDWYKCCQDFSPYLSKSIGVYFFCLHEAIIEKREEESKEDIFGLEKDEEFLYLQVSYQVYLYFFKILFDSTSLLWALIHIITRNLIKREIRNFSSFLWSFLPSDLSFLLGFLSWKYQMFVMGDRFTHIILSGWYSQEVEIIFLILVL